MGWVKGAPRRRVAVLALCLAALALVVLVVLVSRVGGAPQGSAGPEAAGEVVVDCRAPEGGDGSPDAPWRDVAALRTWTPPEGARLLLARGCTWPGPVRIEGPGPVHLVPTGAGEPPTLTGWEGDDVGIEGVDPPQVEAVLTIDAPGSTVRAVRIIDATGPGVALEAPDVTVEDLVIERTSTGVWMRGDRGVARGLRIADLHMLVDTPGGDDDFGAVGFGVSARDVLIESSTCTGCIAPSHDYGQDGGFVDVWNLGDGLRLIDNEAHDVDGFLEIGGTGGEASAVGVLVRGNRITASHGAFWLHDEGTFGMRIEDVRIEDNHVESVGDAQVIGGAVVAVTLIDNTITAVGPISTAGAPAVHEGNAYSLGEGGTLGYEADESESVTWR